MKHTCLVCILLALVLMNLTNAMAQYPTLSIADRSRDEDNPIGQLHLPVSLSSAAPFDVYFTYSTSDGSANAPVDYTAVSGFTQVILAGRTFDWARVNMIADNWYELDETVNISITSAWIDDGQNTPIVITRANGVGTILNDDAIPTIRIQNKSQLEDFPDELRVVVALSNPSAFDAYFTFSTSDGSALVSDNDYTPETNKQVMIRGNLNRIYGHAVVEMINDTYYENDETITVSLTAAWLDDGSNTPLTITNAAATGTIQNDDAMPVVGFRRLQFTGLEGNPCDPRQPYSMIQLVVELDKPATGWEEVTVHLRTNPSYRHPDMVWLSQALPNPDINDLLDGWDDKDVLLQFAKDQVVKRLPIRIFRDCIIEDDEWQQYILLYEKNVTINPAMRVGTLIIQNDDCLPVADFTASAVDGVSPLCVQFINKSTCAGAFLWDFGDGTTSTSEHPRHCFNNPPRKYYTIKLTAYSDDCCNRQNTVVKTNFITVHKPADVAFNASPIAGVPGVEVAFMNQSGGAANKFPWNYGDGTEQVLHHSVMAMIHPTHIYGAAGCYGVSLKGEGFGGVDQMVVPKLIYVDEDYVALQFLEGSATLDGQGWDDAIDHDIISPDASVMALNSGAWAKFQFADLTTKMVTKLRIAVNNAGGSRLAVHLAKDFRLMVSEDGVTWNEALAATIPQNPGYNWDIFTVEPAAKAKHLKLMLCNARGAHSPYVSLCEFQVFAKPDGRMIDASFDALSNSIVEIPADYTLYANYPNPFNPETIISYELPEEADVALRIFNVRGQLISTLVDRHEAAGTYNVSWNGKDSNGNSVAGGLYIYKIIATNADNESFTMSRKMTLLK